MMGLQRKRPIVAHERVVAAPKRAQRISAIDQRIDLIRPSRQRPVAARQCFRVPTELVEDGGTARMCGRRFGLCLERSIDQVESIVIATLLVPKNAKKMQGIKMTRLLHEDGGVKPFCLRQPPPLMEIDGLLQYVARAHLSIAHPLIDWHRLHVRTRTSE